MESGCIVWPLAKNGEISNFFKELKGLTNNNRKLMNFLYALSLQPEIKAMFAHSELNSQGEPTLAAFREKLNIDEILSASTRLKNKAKELGAIDDDDNIIYYDDLNSIISDVLDFNHNNETIKAVIKYSEDGYYIEVDSLNSDNYNYENSLKIRLNLSTDVLSYLSSKGLNTNFSKSVEKLFNPLSIYYTLSTLDNLKSTTQNISITTAQMLTELFESNNFLTRIQAQLGEDTAKAIAQVSGSYVEDPLEITPYTEEQIKKFLNKVKATLQNIINKDFKDLKEESINNTSTSNTYFNTNGISIRDTLKELYTLYHLDQDKVNLLKVRVTKVSEAAKKLIQIKAVQLDLLKSKGVKVNQKVILKIQKDIENEIYLESITSLLKDLEKQIANTQNRLNLFSKRNKNKALTLDSIRNLSSIVLSQLDIVNSYLPIISQLTSIDLLDNDSPAEDKKLLHSIEKIASDLMISLKDLENHARSKQYDAVYAFLKIYWGEDKTLPDGTIVSLGGENGLMNVALKDVNLFDRFLYAATSSNNEVFNLIAEAVKQANDERDENIKTYLHRIRVITSKLFESGSDTSIVFEKDQDGHPVRILSDYDYIRYEKEFSDYKAQIREDPSIDKKEYEELENNWEQEHSKTIKYEYTNSEGQIKLLSLTVPIYDAAVKVKDRLTSVEYEYYKTMLDMKAETLAQIQAADNNTLFDTIEISNDLTTAIKNTKGDPQKIYNLVKNEVIDLLGKREDDISYGTVLNENNLKMVHINANGDIINTLPLFFTRKNKIQDRSRVSTDFSRSMIAFLSSAQQYIQINKILDCLMLSKDWLLTQSKTVSGESGKTNISNVSLGKKIYTTIVSNVAGETQLNNLTQDFFERCVFGKSKKDSRYIFGIKVDKAVDALVGYTSFAGLTFNVLGAEANVLVGKLQMLIDSGMGLGGEFFNMKDMSFADVKYWQLLPQTLNEWDNKEKSSLLGLLMEEFDALDDFYDKIKETGFYKSPISKIIGNTNLFFLYGMGEHLLHAQGMLAVLHNSKNNVLDNTGKEVAFLDAFEVVKLEDNTYSLAIKDGYTKLDGSEITQEDIDKLKKRVAYVNKSMHGAFNSFDKGMIHRYAFGRMIMNFRQWMPAHYSRRFRGLHYDADLGEFREGYYVTAFKFLYGCIKDLRAGKFTLATRWKELQDPRHAMEFYNMKRAIAETMILVMLASTVALLGDAKDHKGNWAYRKLLYLNRRMFLETTASTPLSGPGFIKNAITILNSPAAALNTIDKLWDLLKVTDLSETIENGRYKGENRYWHNMQKNAPHGPLRKMLEMDESNDLFAIFN